MVEKTHQSINSWSWAFIFFKYTIKQKFDYYPLPIENYPYFNEQNQCCNGPRVKISIPTPTNGMMNPLKVGFPKSLSGSWTEIWKSAYRERLFSEMGLVLQVNIDENL